MFRPTHGEYKSIHNALIGQGPFYIFGYSVSNPEELKLQVANMSQVFGATVLHITE